MGRYNGSQQKKLKRLREAKAKAQGNKCHWCEGEFTEMNRPTVDHILPHSKGGKLKLDNIVAACYPCNQERKDLDFYSFKIATLVKTLTLGNM